MNCLMGGMIPVMATAFAGNPDAHDPTRPLFWFHMSVSLMVGFVVAYPMNWWLVANHLKHRHDDGRRPGACHMRPRRRHGDARHGDKPPEVTSRRWRYSRTPPSPDRMTRSCNWRSSLARASIALSLRRLHTGALPSRDAAAGAERRKEQALILVTGHFRIPPEKVDALRPHMREVIEANRKEDGCILFAYGEDVLDPGMIRVVERWRDWPSLDGPWPVHACRDLAKGDWRPPASASARCSPTRPPKSG